MLLGFEFSGVVVHGLPANLNFLQKLSNSLINFMEWVVFELVAYEIETEIEFLMSIEWSVGIVGLFVK